ncbi:hypothetical protein ACWDWO_17600 [Actinopolymorpha singaporensis]
MRIAAGTSAIYAGQAVAGVVGTLALVHGPGVPALVAAAAVALGLVAVFVSTRQFAAAAPGSAEPAATAARRG